MARLQTGEGNGPHASERVPSDVPHASKSRNKSRLPRRVFRALVAVACAIAVSTGVGVAWAATLVPQYNWYLADPYAQEYVITSPAQLAGLAHIVAGDAKTTKGQAIPQHDFTGQTIKCEQMLNLFFLTGWKDTPYIGTAEHPFNGTFDGGTVKFSGFSPEVYSGAQNVGLFGVTGPDSVIKNVELFSTCRIHIDLSNRSGEQIKNVGSIVGWAQGSVENCTSAAEIVVSSQVSATRYMPKTLSCVGGIAGRVDGSLTGCSSTSQMTIKAASDATYGSIAEYIGGVVGYASGAIDSCDYTGGVLNVALSGYGGIGEQGDALTSSGTGLGGIAGIAFGNVSNCTADAQLYAPMMASSGGIIGALRSSGDGATSTLSRCYFQDERTPDIDESGVFGYVSVGGICGTAGTNTVITECQNTAFIRASRWNKPAGAGIVGTISGNAVVSYCYNSGDVTNWTENDLVPGNYVRGIGYYMAGICGIANAGGTEEGGYMPATPEIYACYNRGHVLMSANWRPGAIIGENNGNVHDCYALSGVVQEIYRNGEYVQPMYGRDYGTMENVEPLSQSILCSSQGVAKLNARCEKDSWKTYFTVNLKQDRWPILDWQSTLTDADRTDLNSGEIESTLLAFAAYSSVKDPVPTLRTTLDGNLIYQNADYRVVPQAGARQVTSRSDGDKTPYLASIQGIGRYKGLGLDVCAYGISPADFSTCTVVVTAPAQKYDASTKQFQKADVEVYDEAGGLVDPSEYMVQFATSGTTTAWQILYPGLWQAGSRQDLKAGRAERASAAYWTPGMFIEGAPTDSQYAVTDSYPVLAHALESGNFTGTALGSAKLIKATSLEDDWRIEAVDFTEQGGGVWTRQEDGTFADADGNTTISVTYIGEVYKPKLTVVNIDETSTLKGGRLSSLFSDSTDAVLSRNPAYGDYCYMYGADASAIVDGREDDERNTDVSTATSKASVAVRATSESVGLSEYLRIPFTIVPRDINDEGVDMYAPMQQETGYELDPVELNYNGMTLVKGVDYEIELKDNVEPGMASYVVKGKGNYTGTREGTFEIVAGDQNMIRVDRDFFTKNGEKSIIVRAYSYEDQETPISFASAGDMVFVRAVGSASREVTMQVFDDDGNEVPVIRDSSTDALYAGVFKMPETHVRLVFSYDIRFTYYMREGNGPLQEGNSYTAAELIKMNGYDRWSPSYYAGGWSGEGLPEYAVSSFLWRNSRTGRWYVTTVGMTIGVREYDGGFEDYRMLNGDGSSYLLGQEQRNKMRKSYIVSGEGAVEDREVRVPMYSSVSDRFFSDVPSRYNKNQWLVQNQYGRTDIFQAALGASYVTSALPSSARADTLAYSQSADMLNKHMNLEFSAADFDSAEWGITAFFGISEDEFSSTGNTSDARFVKDVEGVVFSYAGDISKGHVTYDLEGNVQDVYDRNDVLLEEGVDYTIKYEKVSRRAYITPTDDSRYVGQLLVQLPATTLWGDTALETMYTVARNAYTAGAESAVVCTIDGYYDALSAAPYARLIDGPVLLTESDDLSQQTVQAIEDLGAKSVTIVGGPAAVSTKVENQLKSMLGANNVKRIYGQTAVGTANAVAKAGKGSWTDTCVIATVGGYWDALSISPYANANKAPIFMAEEDGSLSEETSSLIASFGFKNIVVTGGTAVVSKNTYNMLARIPTTEHIVRLAGENAYGTSAAVSQWLVEDAYLDGYSKVEFTYTATAFATANGYWDALVASALQGDRRAPLMLYDRVDDAYEIENLLDLRADRFRYVVFLGGESVMPASTRYYITKLLGWTEFDDPDEKADDQTAGGDDAETSETADDKSSGSGSSSSSSSLRAASAGIP